MKIQAFIDGQLTDETTVNMSLSEWGGPTTAQDGILDSLRRDETDRKRYTKEQIARMTFKYLP